MIYEKQKVLGWINTSDIPKLKNPNGTTYRVFIHTRKEYLGETDKVPCYYEPPEHPSAVMNNVFDCAVAINNLFNERNK